MKSVALGFALALTVFAACQSAGAAGTLDTLRQIKIEKGTILILGGKLPSDADFCNWTGAMCELKPGTFGGAEAMSLSTTEPGLIYEFQFHYGAMSSDAVQAQINDYIRTLGKPSKDVTLKNAEGGSCELVWSDSATTFELSYKFTTDPNRAEASATLTDNALVAHSKESGGL
jgi:hypothetical protein